MEMNLNDWEIMALILGALFLIAVVTTAVYLSSSYSCKAQAEKMDVPYDYELFQGCMIKVNNTWVPLDNYRYFGD